MKKTHEQKLAQKQFEADQMRFVVSAGLEALKNPLVAGLAGYAGISLAASIKGSNGQPLMSQRATDVLKGVAVGYPLAASLGGIGGAIAGAAAGSAVGGVSGTNLLTSFASSFGKALFKFP